MAHGCEHTDIPSEMASLEIQPVEQQEGQSYRVLWTAGGGFGATVCARFIAA